MENITKQIEELSDKAAKYEHMRSRYVEVAQQIKHATEILNEVMKEIDPVVGVKTRVPKSGINIKEKIEEQYKRLQVGQQLCLKDVAKAYPNLSAETIKYIFYIKLGRAPQVKKRRNGREMYLYLQKEF